MQTKKFQGIIILKNGAFIRPVIEAISYGQAQLIFKAQYPDARTITVFEIH